MVDEIIPSNLNNENETIELIFNLIFNNIEYTDAYEVEDLIEINSVSRIEDFDFDCVAEERGKAIASTAKRLQNYTIGNADYELFIILALRVLIKEDITKRDQEFIKDVFITLHNDTSSSLYRIVESLYGCVQAKDTDYAGTLVDTILYLN